MSGFSLDSLDQVQTLLSGHPDVGWLDFTRCVRPDGSAYGTGGVCRKGTPEEKAELRKLKSELKMAQGAYAHQKDRDPHYAAFWKNNIDKYLKRISEIEGNIQGKAPVSQKTTAPAKPKAERTATDNQSASAAPPATAKRVVSPPKLTKQEEYPLRSYIAGLGHQGPADEHMLLINSDLRQGGKLTDKQKALVSNMDRALKKLPLNSKGEEHYRGIEIQDPNSPSGRAYLANLKPGNTLKDNAFSSYSKDKDTAETYASSTGEGQPVVFITRSKNLRDVQKFAPANFDTQGESVLPRNLAMKIISVEDKNGIKYVKLEEVTK